MTKKLQFSEESREAIKQINRLMAEADSIFSKLSNDEKDACLEYHNENASLNHCIRWGLQASEEIAEAVDVDIEPDGAATYHGPAALERFWHCVNSFMQDDAIGGIQELVRDENYNLVLRDICDVVDGRFGLDAVQKSLEQAEMIIIDSGNVHGDSWVSTFHPKQLVLSFVTDKSQMEQKQIDAPRG